MKLSERKHFILCSVIEDYIKDAAPITSGGVQDKHVPKVSTATLRNELNALESMGYLKQLHTSGGRIPTPEGYKYYVSTLLEDFEVSEDKLKKVQNLLENETSSLAQILSGIAELISKTTNYPTVMIANGYDKLIIEEVKIIPLIDNEALVLFRTHSGIVKNSMQTNASEKTCDDASLFLTRKFAGKTIGQMLEGDTLYKSLGEVQTFRSLVNSLLESMRKFIAKGSIDIRGESAVNILNEDEHQSVKQTKKILTLLKNKEELASAVESTTTDNITVKIGGEHEKMEGCALITAPIIIKGTSVASIAVLGPDRMDYANIAQALKIVMNELNKTK